MLISFEGGEGVGKTTHTRLLKEALELKGLPVLMLREPGGSFLSEQIRTLFKSNDLDPMTELLLVLAARRHNLINLIEPALSAGQIVIVDRFIDSTLVYQGLLRGLGLEVVENLMRLSGTWLEPDLTVVLDLDPCEAIARISNPDQDRFDCLAQNQHRLIREGFITLADTARHRIVATDQSRELTAASILATVNAQLDRFT